MEHRSDKDFISVPAIGGSDNAGHSNEFDDADTSEIPGIPADRVDKNRPGGDLTTDAGEFPDESGSLSMNDDALETGFLLRGRFEVVELVHSGGMGHVYKAIDNRRHSDNSDQIHVAIKMMRRSLASKIDLRLALEREAARTQRLSHPNIVNIYDFDQDDGQFYLVMEWLTGESVFALLRRTSGQRFASELAWRIIHGVVGGLQHAHSKNVVHADINPSNIFITDMQEIKLLDFGVARDVGAPGNWVDDGPAWATNLYASPEVLSGSTPTVEDDIFSLGCVAYRLLGGALPFAGASSIEAREAGLTVQPIPGLSEPQWQTLSSALSFERSDRPDSVSAFITHLAAANRVGFTGRIIGQPKARWLPVLPIVAIASSAGLWWLWQSLVEDETSAISEATSVNAKLSLGAEATTASPEIGALLGSAALAIDEGRLVMPGEDNARRLFREVLARDSANSLALSGLRTISDAYVGQARIALRAADPAQAITALAIAEETDPLNPAVAVARDLLLAQGNSQLARARLAAAEGDVDRATNLLSDAERYAEVDANAINDVRREIAGNVEERQFLEQLATADAHITAGRLLAPDGNNAQALLIELQQNHDNDSRLRLSKERLGERLLARAAFASATDRFQDASELLDAAETLGVLASDVTAARKSLLSAMEKPKGKESVPARYTAVESGTRPTLSSSESAVATPAMYVADEPTPLPTSSPDVSAAAPAIIEHSGTTGSDEPRDARPMTLSELDIENFVAPYFPRKATRRGLSGFVEVRFNVNTDGSTGSIEVVRAEPGDVFASSAQKAVKKWRFAPRDDSVTAQVTLRFDHQQ